MLAIKQHCWVLHRSWLQLSSVKYKYNTNVIQMKYKCNRNERQMKNRCNTNVIQMHYKTRIDGFNRLPLKGTGAINFAFSESLICERSMAKCRRERI